VLNCAVSLRVKLVSMFFTELGFHENECPFYHFYDIMESFLPMFGKLSWRFVTS
jgi:hypothetical protein